MRQDKLPGTVTFFIDYLCLVKCSRYLISNPLIFKSELCSSSTANSRVESLLRRSRHLDSFLNKLRQLLRFLLIEFHLHKPQDLGDMFPSIALCVL
jgi:hypothetical protein